MSEAPPAYASQAVMAGRLMTSQASTNEAPPPDYTSAYNAGYTGPYPPGDQPQNYGYPPTGAQTPYPSAPSQGNYPPAQTPQGNYPPAQTPQGNYPPAQTPQGNYPPNITQTPYPPSQQTPDSYSQAPQSTSVGMDDDNDVALFTEKSIRLAFIKKVFAMLSIMLLVTFGIMCLFLFVDDIKKYARDHPWLYISSIVVYFAAAIVLICVGETRRKYPQNIICLSVITLSMGVMLGCVTASFEVKEVLIAVGITLLITVAMMLLGFQNKIDFTPLNGVMFVLLLCLMGFGLMCAIFRSDILYIFYASLGALLFSLFIVVDVQLMLGGKHKHSISPEEYIFAALSLYLDIINLFLYILMIVASVKN